MTPPASPDPATLHGLLGEFARSEPDRVALREGSRSVTFSDLWTSTGHLASLLLESGVGEGDVVAVALPRSIDLMVASFAVLRAGAVALPLDLRAPAARNRKIVDAAGALWSLFRGPEPAECVSHLTAIRLDVSPRSLPSPRTEAGQDALLVFTSGSTGEPKGVRLSHAALIHRAKTEYEGFDFTAEDIYLYRTSPAFVGHSVGMALLSRGVSMVVAGDEAGDNASEVSRLMKDFGVTFSGVSPRLIEALLDEVDPEGLASLRVVRSAGESLSAELAGRFHAAAPGCRLIDSYGTTETSGIILAADVAGPRAPQTDAEAGAPLAGVELRLVGPKGTPGSEGEIWVSTPMLASGYLGGESGAEPGFVVEPGEHGQPPLRWYRTGDRGRMTASGRIRVLGRLDFQLNLNGVRAEPGEIETALRRHDSIADAAVWMQPDASGRPRLVAYLIDRDQPAPAAELRRFLSVSLPPPLIPARFVRMRALPLTPSGKVDRQALPRPETIARAAVSPRGREETAILALFREVLEVSDIGVTDDFFEWGGDSLKAVALMARVFETTGIRLPAAVMLNAPTAETLTLRVAQGDPGQVMAVWLRKSGDRPPLTCLPGLAADPMWMLPLMTALDKQQPLLGLSFVGLKPPIDILQASFRGVAELRAAQPRGPYFLLGHSLGGVLAFEMARELTSQGDHVAFVGLLDTLVPGAPRPRPPRRGGLRGLKAVIVSGKAAVRGFLSASGLWPRNEVRFVPGFRQAIERHRVEPCDIAVTHFRAKDQRGGHDPSAAWVPLARGGVEVVEIPGHHFNMLGGANALGLGVLVAAAVERARERVTASRRGSSSR